ncbi:MAG: hypothetical protein ABW096_01455 [Candidatus Thiodiazotropha sp.]
MSFEFLVEVCAARTPIFELGCERSERINSKLKTQNKKLMKGKP